jgi:hypothetical protein
VTPVSAVGSVVTVFIGGSLGAILTCGAWKRWQERRPSPEAEATAVEAPTAEPLPTEAPKSAPTSAPKSAPMAAPTGPDEAPKGLFFGRPADAVWPLDVVEGH